MSDTDCRTLTWMFIFFCFVIKGIVNLTSLIVKGIVALVSCCVSQNNKVANNELNTLRKSEWDQNRSQSPLSDILKNQRQNSRSLTRRSELVQENIR